MRMYLVIYQYVLRTGSHFSVFSLPQVWSFILSFQLTCDHHMPEARRLLTTLSETFQFLESADKKFVTLVLKMCLLMVYTAYI